MWSSRDLRTPHGSCRDVRGEERRGEERRPGEHRPELPRCFGGHLLGVGPVPEDGVAVGHHFGTGLLAKYTHQQHQADEEDHFHLQHHYGETSARIPRQVLGGQSGALLGGY